MGRALTIFFGLLAFGLLCYHCFSKFEKQLVPEIAANANSALAAGGFSSARASADGVVVTLAGTVDSESEKQAAGRAVLAADGVVKIDNNIAVDVVLPPPGPDPTPVVPPETQSAAAFPDSTAAAFPDSTTAIAAAVASDDPVPEPAPVVPITESLQVVLDGPARRADVAGRSLASSVDAGRLDELGRQITEALPGWTLNNSLAANANVPTDLRAAVTAVLPVLTGSQAAQLDADAQGIRVDAKLASFAERAALQARLEQLAGSATLADQDLSWVLDSPAPSEDGCQQAFDELLKTDSIMFTTSKAEIRPRSFALLDKLVGVARDCNVRVEIEGHTDSRGPAEFNNYLSLERARSVRAYLISQGVDRDRISAKGLGSSRPIDDNNTINGRQANRRIEFRVIRTDT